jgi:threonine dehydrogenase-like Zn-dependent dehydrogenase
MGGGQVLAKVLACGICGSDLHMLVHGEESRRLSAEMAEGQAPNPGSPIMFEPHRDTVMGHEFCCEVLDVGPGVNNLKQGDIVVSFPVTFDEQGVHGIGFSNKYPGGYSERIVINEMMSIKVPNGLPAELLGADVVVDPREVPAIEAWRKIDGKKPLVIFEAVGVPGMIQQAMRMAPKDARILIVGACMQEDHMHPMLGIGKELSLQFVLGYSPTEFGNALTAIAEGKVDLSPLITGRVGIDGVPQAFKDLGDPEQHAKILVMPK